MAGSSETPTASWAAPAEEALRSLGVESGRGLEPAELARRRRRYGFNRLREIRRRSALRMLWDQLASPIVGLLAAATLVALIFGEQLEALAIGVVIVVNAAIGFLTERRAVRSMEALRDLGRVHATVRRDGRTCVVPAEELVPGDIVLVEAGDVLSADLRIALASRLQVDEALLTGESLPVDKGVDPVPADAPLTERASMLFKGTAVTRGSGEGIVVATGMATELGQISLMVEEAEPEITPLEERLERLGRGLILLTLALAVLVAAAGIWGGRELYLSIEMGIALAVAAVPEGLPIVATVALARGMWRMARRHALVERLSAVETLGSTSVILTDKTGTLTESRMSVADLLLSDGGSVAVEATGFRRDGTRIDPNTDPLLRKALRVAALCNNAELEPSGVRGTGDPMELALLAAARAGGLERGALLADAPELGEIAFDSEAKRMATLHGGPEPFAAIKGAPESVIPACRRLAGADGAAELDAPGRAGWLKRADALAQRGARVLALATRPLEAGTDFGYRDLTFVGLVGLLDPPRPGAREAVDGCQAAGIRVVMVTGDHGATAWNIAAATGLIDPSRDAGASFLDASSFPRLGGLSQNDARAVLRAPVIARASPRQKLELISLFQHSGEVVAMTGDGVNDAPALRKADIGIAMGRRGTQVAREAADMVLQDDELATIVSAVAQGRAIFANIRKFLVYLLSCNVSEILTVVIASLAQGPLALMPLQILFLNLVTDVFPALALGVGEGSPELMHRPPRRAEEPLLERRHWVRVFWLGGVISAVVLATLALASGVLGKTAREATTISFLTLALAQLWHVFSMRDRGSGWWRNEITRNPWIWGSLLLCLALLGVAVHWPLMATVLAVADPGADGWTLAVSMSLVPLAAGQLGLALRGRDERRL